ncbi:MAG: hypothetical protein ACXWQO_11680 [Bdellovibrionota bacterium]
MPILPKNGDKKKRKARLRLVTARQKIYVFPDGSDHEPISGFGFVGDFSDGEIALYAGRKLRLQTPVHVAFGDSGAVTYRGHVIWTEQVALSQNFLGHESLKYRIGIKFLFVSEAERQRYLAYFAGVRHRVQEINLGI